MAEKGVEEQVLAMERLRFLSQLPILYERCTKVVFYCTKVVFLDSFIFYLRNCTKVVF